MKYTVAFAVLAIAAARACLDEQVVTSRWPFGWAALALAAASFSIYRISRRRDAAIVEIAPNVWFGRRPTPAEAADSAAWSAVLDLAAEFPRAAVRAEVYQSMPLLDGLPVAVRTLAETSDWIDEHAARGPVLIHCALGHGRSGSIVLAWMGRDGESPTSLA